MAGKNRSKQKTKTHDANPMDGISNGLGNLDLGPEESSESKSAIQNADSSEHADHREEHEKTYVVNDSAQGQSSENLIGSDTLHEKENGNLSQSSIEPVAHNSDQDVKTFRLLELIDEYEALANESFRSNYISGFLELSRANYYGSQRFNMDSIDMRPRDASTVVESLRSEFVLKDLWQLRKERIASDKAIGKEKNSSKGDKDQSSQADFIEVKVKESKSSYSDDSRTEKTPDIGHKAVTSSAMKIDTEVRNRKSRKSGSPTNVIDGTNEVAAINLSNEVVRLKDVTPKDEARNIADPLYQFGRLVPYQLRTAKSHFQNALEDSLKLLRLQQEISLLVSDLEM